MTQTEFKPVEICPDGHVYNGNKYGARCPNCGKLKTPEAEEEQKTSEQSEEEKLLQKQARVCGWLVCVKGPNEGRDYKVREGKNFIGSDPNMDIYINGDRRVNKRNHAAIIYDCKSRKSMLLPGDSSGMVYLNKEAIYAPCELDSLDQIELGESVFFFVPFCQDRFDWADLSDLLKGE